MDFFIIFERNDKEMKGSTGNKNISSPWKMAADRLCKMPFIFGRED